MLSRVAARLYWMARYLERAEDTARLTQSYSHLIMDIPRGSDLGWDVLIQIFDAQSMFTEHYRAYNEQNVLRFLIAEPDNGSSIYTAIRTARENVRTTRDVLPAEVWEHVNELYLYTQEFADSSVGRRHRQQFLDQIIARCRMISGLIMTTMCRDHAYRFIKLGQLLERADMTTRVIDVGAAALLAEERPHTSVDPLIWASMLRSLSAMGSYQRTMGPVVEANHVVNFVFREQTLPRSVKFCLDSIRDELAPLNNNHRALHLVDRSRRSLSRFNVEQSDREALHAFIDRLQQGLNSLSETINANWFTPEQR